MKYRYLFLFLLALFVTRFFFFAHTAHAPSESDYISPLTIAGVPLQVAIADTDAKRTQGLSGREPLGESEGMLFVFEQDRAYSFWMKDMRFSIDILWIDAAGKVVSLEKNVSPETYPHPFTPSTPARYVLELAAGFSDRHGVGVGSVVSFR